MSTLNTSIQYFTGGSSQYSKARKGNLKHLDCICIVKEEVRSHLYLHIT